MNTTSPQVAIVMGSRSDWEVVEHAVLTLKRLGVRYAARILSAHRTPEALTRWVREMEESGVRVFIAAAGGAAHLGGVVAAQTALPVLGVPMQSRALGGLDSLLSMVQMPAGVPVATLAIGKAGAVNAALFAAAILGLDDPKIAEAWRAFRTQQAERVLADGDPEIGAAGC